MRTALVGESNYSEFEVLNDFLTAKGFQVHWVKSGPDAVEAFADLRPELVILDALIPGLTGLKVCQQIRRLPGGEQTKTILLSKVYRQFQKQYESRQKVGVDAYNEKPVNVADLEKTIQSLLPPEEMPTPQPEPTIEVEALTEPESEVVSTPETETRRKLGVAGDLADTPFPKLLYFLHRFKRTGALRVTHEHISKVIYLRDGNPVFVTSNLSNESLGRFMVQRGIITLEQYNSSLERMLTSGRQQGAVLIEMNVLTPHQLFEALEAQIKEKILRVFAWDNGEYEFRPGRFEVDQSMQLRIPTLVIIFEGIKRFYHLARLERYFNEYKNQRLVRVSGSMLDDGSIALRPAEAKFVRLIDGERTVGKIIARSNLSLTETFQTLYFLLLTEVIRFVGDPGFASRGDREQAAYVEQRKARRDDLRRRAEDREGAKHDRMAQFRRAVTRLFNSIDKKDYYALFDLPRTATVDQVKQAYHTLTRKYHPFDLYNEADDVIKAKSDGIFRTLSAAYETLVDTVQRQKYDAELLERIHLAETPAAEPAPVLEEVGFDVELDLARPPTAPEERADSPDIEWDVAAELSAQGDDDVNVKLEDFQDRSGDDTVREATEVTASMGNLLKSELLFQRGEEALEDGDAPEARRLFGEALKLSPNEAEYYAYLGWATYTERPNDPAALQEGRDLLERAISINPGLDNAYTFLGLIELHQGQKQRAREHFERAVQYNPDNQRAVNELKKLEVG